MQEQHEELVPILDLHERGLYLQALREGEARLGPIRGWKGAGPRVLASRLVTHLGAPRLSLWHRLKSWKEAPQDPEVRYFFAWTRFEQYGPLATWRFLMSQGDMPDAPAETRLSWYGLHAQIAAMLRDFDRADEWIQRALEVVPDNAWIHVTRSSVLLGLDRHEEALAAVDHALALRPWYRPAVQSRAHVLTMMVRDDEVTRFLEEAEERLECSGLSWQLGVIHIEKEQFETALTCLDRYRLYSPMLERQVAAALHRVRSYVLYRLGRIDEAIAESSHCRDAVTRRLTQRLQDPAHASSRRVTLPVGFVQQHHKTCVPATLSAISRFWSRSADHLQVAEAICYDGTSSYSERKWAEENGWYVREFSVDEDSARRLIDAGIPFTLTTTEPGSAHLQAVIGYDGRRGTLVIRDPSHRVRAEMFVDELARRYAAWGPRGMAMVPVERRGILEALNLPDFEIWDGLHRLDGALNGHRRQEAQQTFENLLTRFPEHVLTHHARWRLSLYDSQLGEQAAALEKLHALHPKNAAIQLSFSYALQPLSRQEERVELLRKRCEGRDSNPVFFIPYAQELAADSRRHAEARTLFERAIRARPGEARAYSSLANLLWSQMKFDEALELYRFAACLDDLNEAHADAYFRAAQHCGKADACLDWLRRRFERFGNRSGLPARTYHAALDGLERGSESFQMLEDALKRRPEDGELMLYVAGVYASTSSDFSARAHELLEKARPRTARPGWLRVAARMAAIRGEPKEALQLYREILELQPLAVDAFRAVARLLAETEGREKALEHLERCADRFPHYQPFVEHRVEWLRDEPPEVMEPVIRGLIALNPSDGWAVRELGFFLLRQRRLDEAAVALEDAGRLDPHNMSWYHLAGMLAASQGNTAKARSAFREAIRVKVDNEYAIGELISSCDTPDQKRVELDYIRQQLSYQTLYGDGLLCYAGIAADVLDAAALLAQLTEVHAARPDLWHTWAAMVRQLVKMDRLDEARSLAVRATERFPLLPRIWLERATVCRVMADEAGEEEALQTVHRINPSWGEGTRQLSELHRQRGDLDRARALLELAMRHDPLDAVNCGWMAEVLWMQEHHEEALQHLERAVLLAPGYDWAWSMLSQWSEAQGDAGRPERAVRDLVARRPGEPRSWLFLARILEGDERLEERLAALDRALELNARSLEAYLQKARLLTAAGRFDEAVAACRPAGWKGEIPASLRAREACVTWARGDRPAALAALREALRTDPGMGVAWRELMDWTRELGHEDLHLEACRGMLAVSPHDEVALESYGQALIRGGKRDEAKEFYRQSFAMRRGDAYSGLSLFDLLFEDGELAEAESTLAALEATLGGPFSQARRVQLACKRGEREPAARALTQLAVSTMNGEWPIEASFRAMLDAGFVREASEAVGNQLGHPSLQAGAAAWWVIAQIRLGNWQCHTTLRAYIQDPGVAERAVYAWVDAAVRGGQKADEFLEFVRINRPWLESRTHLWGTVCYGFAVLRQWPAALAWARQWRRHPDALSWMLVNVVEAFRAEGHDAEAAEVSRHAITAPPDNGTVLHHVWLAHDEITAGEADRASSRLYSLDVSALDEDFAFLHKLILCRLEMREAPAAERASIFERVRSTVEEQVRDYSGFQWEPARRRFYYQCVERLAEEAGTWGAWLWSMRRRLLG